MGKNVKLCRVCGVLPPARREMAFCYVCFVSRCFWMGRSRRNNCDNKEIVEIVDLGPPTELYRHFNCDGYLLYVGISFSATKRFAAHRRKAKWAKDLTTITIERFADRRSAEIAEMNAIINERPKENITWSVRDQK